MDWERQTVRTEDGTDLAVWLSGSTEGEPLVFVHGFSLDHTTWEPTAGLLVGQGFRVLATDLRGHGGSPLGPTSPTVDQLVADLAELLVALDLPAVHLVGHSLGAVVVLAARVDDRLAGALRSVTAIAATERAVQNPIMKLGARLFSSGPGIRLLRRRRPGRLMISTWFGRRPEPAHLDWIRELSAACAPTTRAAMTTATSAMDLRPTFAAAGPPTMIICGQKDRATSPKVSTRISAAIDGAQLHLVEDAGHMVIIERPATIAELLASWVSKLGGGMQP